MKGSWPVVAACACALALGVAACGGDDDKSGGGDKKGSAATEEKVTMSFILAALDNPFYVAQKDGIEAEAAKHPEADVSVSAGRSRTSADQVVSLIEDATAKGVDVIAVNGSDTKPLIPVLTRVIDQDIPLVLFDAPADELKSQYAGYVGTDNGAGGLAAGEWLKGQLPDGGDVGLIVCVAGHPVTQARVDGFKEGAGDGFKVVATLDAECDRAKARKVAEDLLAAHPDVDAVFSTSDTQTMGALPAFKASGSDALIISFDAQPEAVDAIKAGTLDATAGWSAKELGAEAFLSALAAAKGEQVPASKTIPTTVVDKTNADSWEG
ncbi:MAG: ribose transport system substrate-binding protein [Thermoleophilaceae bacterium]|jgi:ribose transport system substrate-binding protein|nr:ribose transport system substrate-binding protein [Thermoleophilaceae bacterium]